jgi:hypothetical protein
MHNQDSLIYDNRWAIGNGAAEVDVVFGIDRSSSPASFPDGLDDLP